jgi:hypothetical protein
MKVYGLPPTVAIQSSLPSIVLLGTGLAQAFSSYMSLYLAQPIRDCIDRDGVNAFASLLTRAYLRQTRLLSFARAFQFSPPLAPPKVSVPLGTLEGRGRHARDYGREGPIMPRIGYASAVPSPFGDI